jgi:hypothetical protein
MMTAPITTMRMITTRPFVLESEAALSSALLPELDPPCDGDGDNVGGDDNVGDNVVGAAVIRSHDRANLGSMLGLYWYPMLQMQEYHGA